MLSYQHAYHAGNRADVHKHALLALVLRQMTAKPGVVHYAETHAGRGLYDCFGMEMQKVGEFADGVARVDWRRGGGAYGAVVRGLNGGQDLRWVPGSPAVAANVLREGDALHLCEKHPGEVGHLRASFGRMLRRPNVHVHFDDGPTLVPKLVRPGQRWVVLLDPSFEQKAEYAGTTGCVAAILRKAPQAVVLVWAPVLAGGAGAGGHGHLGAGLAEIAPDLWESSWDWEGHAGMVGSRMWAVNLPYPLAAAGDGVVEAELAPLAQAVGVRGVSRWVTPRT